MHTFSSLHHSDRSKTRTWYQILLKSFPDLVSFFLTADFFLAHFRKIIYHIKSHDTISYVPWSCKLSVNLNWGHQLCSQVFDVYDADTSICTYRIHKWLAGNMSSVNSVSVASKWVRGLVLVYLSVNITEFTLFNLKIYDAYFWWC